MTPEEFEEGKKEGEIFFLEMRLRKVEKWIANYEVEQRKKQGIACVDCGADIKWDGRIKVLDVIRELVWKSFAEKPEELRKEEADRERARRIKAYWGSDECM